MGLNTVEKILADYEKLINRRIQIPLSNGDMIDFKFHAWDLPHLLGLQHLKDIPAFFEYSQDRISAKDIYYRLLGKEKYEKIEFETIEASAYYDEVYKSRIKYFSSERILDIISARQLVKFDPKKIKCFETKLEKVDYMFWKRYRDEDDKWGYFGIGFMASGKETDKNYPNTFFFRLDDDYIANQEVVLPLSIMQEDKEGQKQFEIYWDEVIKSLKKNPHCKKLRRYLHVEEVDLALCKMKEQFELTAQREIELLYLDAVHSIYTPFWSKDYRWTNEEKRFVCERIDEAKTDFLPGEIKNLLNEYRQR